jgi:hypothetical protein
MAAHARPPSLTIGILTMISANRQNQRLSARMPLVRQPVAHEDGGGNLEREGIGVWHRLGQTSHTDLVRCTLALLPRAWRRRFGHPSARPGPAPMKPDLTNPMQQA